MTGKSVKAEGSMEMSEECWKGTWIVIVEILSGRMAHRRD